MALPASALSLGAPGSCSRYQVDTMGLMLMTLRLTDDEQAALRERAAAEGISMQDAARRAVREYVARGAHQDRVAAAARRIQDVHADALRRLGE
jgi:plasmid stability protein